MASRADSAPSVAAAGVVAPAGALPLPGAVGYVYLPALVLISLVSMFTAPVGARQAHRLPVATLKKIFAGVLILLSAKMLHTVLGA